MSKFPSLQNVLYAIEKTVFRFPLETITSICGTIFAIILIDLKYNDPTKEVLVKAIMSCSLCLVLFLSISLFFFAFNKNNLFRFLACLFLGSLAIAFVFSFHKEITKIELQQFFVLNIALHLLVSFAGFLPKKYIQEEFWEFNKQLFLRILTAALYSTVLYSGLALAILAIKELFNIEFNEKIYGYLFFVISGIFNTIFFLNGVPETNCNEKRLVLDYPNGLKNFTQYVLLPLISLYLIILIGYEAKIIITFSLPVGWVSYLVLVFAIFGILSFLLVHPIATEKGNLWMRTFNRWFYYLLIPLLGLLFWAILYRIHLYGVTHERYYVLLLSIWLTIVVAYFLIQKQPKIKFIPISMCIAGLLSIVGPQSADSISKNSQFDRFESYLQIIKKEKLSFKQEQDLSSIIDFLDDNYGVEIFLVSEAKEKFSSLLKKDKDPGSFKIMKTLGLVYHDKYERENNVNSGFYYDYSDREYVDNIQGYDMIIALSNYSDLDCEKCIQKDKVFYSVKSSKKDYGVDLLINNDTIPLRIFDFINKNSEFDNNQIHDKKITQLVEYSKYRLLITYLNVNGVKGEGRKVVENFDLKVMVKIK